MLTGAEGWDRIPEPPSHAHLPQLHKLEELVEQERKVRTAMMNRAGLLALMLHQTIQHDPLTTDLRSKVAEPCSTEILYPTSSAKGDIQ